jgi:hypothetical protein
MITEVIVVHHNCCLGISVQNVVGLYEIEVKPAKILGLNLIETQLASVATAVSQLAKKVKEFLIKR